MGGTPSTIISSPNVRKDKDGRVLNSSTTTPHFRGGRVGGGGGDSSIQRNDSEISSQSGTTIVNIPMRGEQQQTSLEMDEFHHEGLSSLVLNKLEGIIGDVNHLTFNKPDSEVFNPSLLYEVVLSDDKAQNLFVIKRLASRFQPRNDIVVVTKEGDTLFRLINPKRMVHKMKVLTGDTVIGSIVKSKLNIMGPKFRLRGPDKKDIAVIESSRKYCCMTCQKLCCVDNFGIFQVIQKTKHHPMANMKSTSAFVDKNNNEDQLLGMICRDVSFNDRAGHDGIMEIWFENNVNIRLKCLLIAAAIFIDFSIFVPQPGQVDVKILIATGFVLFVIFGLSMMFIR